MSIKPKVSHVLSSQVPAFFQGTAANFVKFIEYYFEWLENDGNPLDYIRYSLEQHDYDTADEKFKTLIANGVLNNLPLDTSVDKSLLIKNSKQFFRSKGSEDSFRFLFKTIYGEDVEIDWGRDLYTKSSDSVYRKNIILALKKPNLEATVRMIKGAVDAVNITDSDYGIYLTPEVSFVRNINDDLTDNLPTVSFTMSGGALNTFTIIDGKSHWTLPPTVEFTGTNTTPIKIQLILDSNGTVIDSHILDPGSGYIGTPTLTWTVSDTRDAKVRALLNNSKVSSIEILDGGTNYINTPSISFDLPTYDYTSLKGNRIVQVGEYATAIVDDVISTVINGTEYYILYLQKKGLFGNFNTDSIVRATINGSDIIGLSTPIFSDIELNYRGSGYKKGQVINFDDDGAGGSLSIDATSFGSVDTAIIANGGSGYTVGDKVTSDDALGKGFSGFVSSIDGVDLNTITVMELDEINFLNKGYDFQINDLLYIYGGDLNIEDAPTGSKLAEIQVTGIVTSSVLNSITINNGGSKYAYTSFAILPDANSNSPLRQIRTDYTSYDNGVVETTKGAIKISKNPIGAITKVDWQLTDSNLGDSTVSVVVNGVNGLISPTIATGAITAVSVDNEGINYVDPIVVVNTTTGTGAEFDVVIDEFGSITDVIIIRQGSNYGVSDTLIVKEAKGSGAVLTANLKNGGINTFDIISRGEFFEINKYGVNKYTIQGGHGSGLDLDLYYRPLRIFISNPGQNYLDYTSTISEGHGVGFSAEPNIKNGVITDILMTNNGSGYTWALVEIVTSVGVNFRGTAVLSADQIVSITINDGGYDYDVMDTIIISGDGIAATAEISELKNGTIKSISVTSSGYGYHHGCLARVNSKLRNPLSAASITPVIDYGKITSISITDGGLGYFDSVNITNINWNPSTAIITVSVDTSLLLNVGDVISIGGVNPSSYNGSYIINEFNIAKDLFTATTHSTLGAYVSGGFVASSESEIEIYYDDTSPHLATYAISGSTTKSITSISVDAGGSGYYSNAEREPLILTVNGSGIGATAVATVNLNSGAVDSIDVTDGGEYYSFPPDITIVGDGTNATAEATITDYVKSILVQYEGEGFVKKPNIVITAPNNPLGVQATATANVALLVTSGTFVSRIEVLQGGYGYTIGNTSVSIINGGGSNATAVPVINGGIITAIDIVDGGSGYTSHPTVQITGDGAGAAADAWIPCRITSINITEEGSGYSKTTPPTVTAIGGYGNGAILTPVIDSKVDKINVLTPGSGYTTASVTVDDSAKGGTGAELLPILENGSFVDVLVVDGGQNYTGVTITIQGGKINGTEAVLTPVIENGIITRVGITNPGTGYYYGTYATVIGDGTGAVVELTVDTGITRMEIINSGSGYSAHDTVLVVDDVAPPGTLPGGGASLIPIIKDGKIITAYYSNQGQGYHNPTVTVQGSGTGAIIEAYADRPIVNATLTTAGQQYTHASVKVTGDGNNAVLRANISNNSIQNFNVTYKGNRYSQMPNLNISDNSGYGAISKITIQDGGYGYKEFPVLTVTSNIGTGAEIRSFSKSIGQIESIKFTDYAIGVSSVPMIRFPATIAVSENVNFITNEYVYVKQDPAPIDIFSVPHARVVDIDRIRNLLYVDDMSETYEFITETGYFLTLEGISQDYILHEYSDTIVEGSTLVGEKSKSECVALKYNRAQGTGILNGVGIYDNTLIKSQSLTSSPLLKIHDNKKYQDYSYIIKSGIPIESYSSEVNNILHPTGYSMYGDIKIVTHTKVARMIAHFTQNEDALDLSSIRNLVLPTTEPTFYANYNYENWRQENDPIFLYDADTIPEYEFSYLDGVPYNVNSASVTTIIESKEEIGTGTYALASDDITISLTAHGLEVDDRLILSFTSGGCIAGEYYVKSKTADSFVVTAKTNSYSAQYVGTGSTTVTLNSTLSAVNAGDTIDVVKLLPVINGVIEGDIVDDEYTVATANATTITFTNPVNVTTTGDNNYVTFDVITCSGDVDIFKITAWSESSTSVIKWVIGDTHSFNDIVYYVIAGVPTLYFFTSTEAIATSDNGPVGVNTLWEPLSNIDNYAYTF